MILQTPPSDDFCCRCQRVTSVTAGTGYEKLTDDFVVDGMSLPLLLPSEQAN